jgi:two-component system, NtrC family, sensor histidine kinase GlrK
MKKSLRPTSVLQLALIAFALVGVPLVIALLTATLAVDRLASQSRESVLQAAHIIDSGRALVEELTAMERNARQFQLLGDDEFFDAYLRRRENFLGAAQALGRHPFPAEYHEALAALEAEERDVLAVLASEPPGSEASMDAVSRFPALGDAARRILADSGRAIGREAGEMRQQAAELQRRLFLQTLAVIPAALILAILGTVLITRPIRQMNRAIRRLGSGHFEDPVEVRGPRDLEEVGERLEWLRLRLLDLDAQKVRFLRHVSHELKTPLTAIREGAQLLSDQVAGELTPAQEEIAGILCKSSVQLQRRIEDLLSFNTIVHGLGAPVSHEPLDVGLLLNQVLEDQMVSIRAKQLHIETDAVELTIAGEREQLRIVLDNLLSNAIKYSPAGGRIRIGLRERNGLAVIEVQDEGPGISPEERAKVFEPFYQGSAIHNGHVKGTGLGLSITQEYVRAHRGSIEIADVQRGACLRVCLPLVAGPGAEESTPGP